MSGEYGYMQLGDEGVKRAAQQMEYAAEQMNRAASTIWEAVDRLATILADDRAERGARNDWIHTDNR